MKKYVLIGGAGYVAPKHYKAIKETGGDLLAILDPHDSVGILDSYFPKCEYFSSMDSFWDFCNEHDIDYAVVCSPNYNHLDHCMRAIYANMDVICEKPTVLTPDEYNQLRSMELQFGHSVNSILQLRLSSIIADIAKFDVGDNKVDLVYYTPRGNWFNSSWKGDYVLSGGLSTSIGVHLLDLLLLLYGPDYKIISWYETNYDCIGVIQFGTVKVHITLSIDMVHKSKRILSIGNTTFDLSKNFTDLHTGSYKQILAGNGIKLSELLPTIKLCADLRN